MSFFYVIRQLWRFAKRDRWKVALNTTFHLISFVGPLIQPYAFGRMIGALQRYGLSDMSQTMKWLMIYILGFVIFEVFHRSARHIQISSALFSRRNFSLESYGILNRLPMSWHTNHHSGEIVDRINHAGEALEEFGVTTDNYLERFIGTIGPVVILAGLSLDIAVIALGVGLTIFITALRMNTRIHPILKRQKKALHAFNSRLYDYISNIKTVITLRRESETVAELGHRFGEYSKQVLGENKINQVRCFILAFGAICSEVVIFLYYFRKCRIGAVELDVGYLVIVAGYVKTLSESLFSLASSFYDLLRQRAACESAGIILQNDPGVSRRDHKGALSWRRMRITGLSFGYSDEKRVFSNIELTLSRTERVALIGFSGGGKSTLLEVLRGLYPASSGELFIDDLGGNDISVIRGCTTLFPQTPEIFEHTILFNITFGIEADPDRLVSAIRVSRFEPVLERLPGGVYTDIRERGVNLSGGELKRLALARGIYASAGSSLLLLDEPTAHIDMLNTGAFFDALFAEFPETCILCTVHDLELLPRFDRILVLDSGSLESFGSVPELEAGSSLYRRLAKSRVSGESR